jgi:hypothetical protein
MAALREGFHSQPGSLLSLFTRSGSVGVVIALLGHPRAEAVSGGGGVLRRDARGAVVFDIVQEAAEGLLPLRGTRLPSVAWDASAVSIEGSCRKCAAIRMAGWRNWGCWKVGIHRFSDWPNESVPKIAAGVYSIWDSGRLIYVGMAGRGPAAKDVSAPDEPLKAKGLSTRMNSDWSGRRSGDQFCVYVRDRFIVPILSARTARADRRRHAVARRAHAGVHPRTLRVPIHHHDRRHERQVQGGALGAGKLLAIAGRQ